MSEPNFPPQHPQARNQPPRPPAPQPYPRQPPFPQNPVPQNRSTLQPMRPPQQVPRSRPVDMQSYETARDIDAALAARRELGPEYDEHIAGGIADRVEELVAYRTAELRQGSTSEDREWERDKSVRAQRLALGLASLGAGIPITAIAATQVEPSLLGIVVSWAGIVAINVAHAWTNRRN